MRLTLKDLRDSFLSWVKSARAERTVEHYARNLDAFLLAVGNLAVEDLRAHHLLTWGQRWHQVQAVQRLFQWAAFDAELIERNPFQRVKRPRLGRRCRVLTRGQLARMLRAAGPALRRFMLAQRETLARPQEVRALRWEDLHCPGPIAERRERICGGGACFVLEEYKGRAARADPETPRVIPITPRLGRLLLRLEAAAGAQGGPIFLNTAGRPWTRNAVRCAFRALRRRLNIGRDQRGENIVAYTVRHSVATWATAAGVRDRVLADLMGHASTATTARYQHLSTEHLAHAMRSIHARPRRGNRPPLPPPC